MKIDFYKIADKLRGLTCNVHMGRADISVLGDSVKVENVCCSGFQAILDKEYERLLDDAMPHQDSSSSI